MKKKLLFVMTSMKSGGGERSLLTLLSLLDFDLYDVELFLFEPSGLFFEMLPKQVRVLPLGENYSLFRLPLKQSVRALLSKGRVTLAVSRVLYSYKLHSGSGSMLEHDQRAWKYLKKAFADERHEYDAAIGYLEGNSNFFVADCVKAATKIGYIHSDYNKLEMNPAFDAEVLKKIDFLVGVSPECSAVLKEKFPDAADKIRTVENITSPRTIAAMARCGSAPEMETAGCTRLLTVGRLSPPKGYDFALSAAELMKQSNFDFKWFVIGKGELGDEISAQIKEKHLEENFILLGERANPYPYIAGCDIYVQPSHYEGKSIAIDEAKCLAKPIVATKFTTVCDQLADESTALLAEMNGADIAAKIMRLAADERLRDTLAENLKKEDIGNENEIKNFYEMLGD